MEFRPPLPLLRLRLLLLLLPLLPTLSLLLPSRPRTIQSELEGDVVSGDDSSGGDLYPWPRGDWLRLRLLRDPMLILVPGPVLDSGPKSLSLLPVPMSSFVTSAERAFEGTVSGGGACRPRKLLPKPLALRATRNSPEETTAAEVSPPTVVAAESIAGSIVRPAASKSSCVVIGMGAVARYCRVFMELRNGGGEGFSAKKLAYFAADKPRESFTPLNSISLDSRAEIEAELEGEVLVEVRIRSDFVLPEALSSADTGAGATFVSPVSPSCVAVALSDTASATAGVIACVSLGISIGVLVRDEAGAAIDVPTGAAIDVAAVGVVKGSCTL